MVNCGGGVGLAKNRCALARATIFCFILMPNDGRGAWGLRLEKIPHHHTTTHSGRILYPCVVDDGKMNIALHPCAIDDGKMIPASLAMGR